MRIIKKMTSIFLIVLFCFSTVTPRVFASDANLDTSSVSNVVASEGNLEISESEGSKTDEKNVSETDLVEESELASDEQVLPEINENGEVANYSSRAAELGLTINYPSQIKCGEPTTFTLNASGGSGNYKYRIYSLYDSELVSVYDVSYGSNGSYKDSNEFTFTFYASGIYYIRFSVMDMDTYQTVNTGLYEYPLNIQDSRYPSVEQIVNTVTAQCLAACTTDFEKAVWLHDWIIDHADYDYSYSYCSAEGVLARGEGTCEAYHRAYVKLLNKVGIQTGRITGNGHVWTAVKMDGEWYQVDSTWDDMGENYQNSFYKHMYFGLTDYITGLVHSDHTSAVAGYESTALENNYFIKTGEIKQWSDPFADLVQQNIAEGKTEFVLTVTDSMPDNYKNVIYNLVAYQLSKQEWGNSSVSVSYSNNQLTCKAEQKKPAPEEKPGSGDVNQLKIEKNQNESVLTVTLSKASVSGNTQISFPVWGEAGGQNDIIWYQGRKIADGTYEAKVPVSSHKEAGKYIIHVYANTNGKLSFLTNGQTTVTGITAGEMICNMGKSSIAGGKYRIEVKNITSPSEITRVQIPVWSDANGQDDIIWYTAKKDGNLWYVDVELKNHKYGAGLYHAHAYATDSRGITKCVKTLKYTADKMDVNQLKIEKNQSESVMTVTLTKATVSGNAQVTFPVWGEAGGQNDIIWYQGRKIADGTYEAKVPISSHKETGKYHIHVYANTNGIMSFLTSGQASITGIAADDISCNLQKSSPRDGKYRIEVKNLTSPSSITRVQIPVWSDRNGQDDIRWYNAVKDGNVWYADVNICDHKYDAGKYHAHAYATDSRGIMQFVKAAGFTVQEVKRNELQISMDKEQRYMTVTLKAVAADEGILFPVWGVTGGQNDLVWYTGTRIAPYTYKVVVDISRHKEAGEYAVHVYGKLNGKQSFLTAGKVTVDGISKGTIEAVNEKAGMIDVKISGLTGPSEIVKVLVPTWTQAGGQDDIRWYEAKKKQDGWYLQINTANHNSEAGTYNIHVYATDKRGIQEFAGLTTVSVKK